MTGSSHHFARQATWAAKEVIGTEATKSGLLVHKKAGAAKHNVYQFDRTTAASGGIHSEHEPAWADVYDEDEPEPLGWFGSSLQVPPLDFTGYDIDLDSLVFKLEECDLDPGIARHDIVIQTDEVDENVALAKFLHEQGMLPKIAISIFDALDLQGQKANSATLRSEQPCNTVDIDPAHHRDPRSDPADESCKEPCQDVKILQARVEKLEKQLST